VQHDRNPDVDARQAAIAERLEVEPDNETPSIRHFVFEGQRVGKAVYMGDDEWALLYRSGGAYTDSFSTLMSPLSGVEEAERDGVGWVADAIAHGEIRLDEGEGDR